MSVGWSLSASSWMVNADEDIEIINVNDPAVWAAFKFWSYYGVTPDYENVVEQIYTTSGTQTLTGSFNFTGSFSGSFDATVQLSVDTLIGTELADVDNILTGYTHYYLDKDEVQLNIHPTDYATEQNNGFAFACTYNAQSTSANAQMTCTPTSGLAQTVILPDAEITFDSIDTLFNSVTNYSIALTLRNQGTEVGTLTGTLGGSIGGSGTVNLSGVYNETTQTTNHTKYSFTLPMGKTSNNRIGPVTYDGKMLFRGSQDDPWVEAWISTNGLKNHMKLFLANGNEVNSSLYTLAIRDVAPWMSLEFFEYRSPNNAWMNFTHGIVFDGLYPLYSGPLSAMSDDMYRFIYKGDRTIDKIDEQIAADQQHHDEMMDTSDSAKIQTDGDALVVDADEKFGDLFFPLNHAIETANDLANVNATGVIRLPAIFSNGDYWYLDLTQIEQKLPTAWSFIRSLCQLAVAIYLIHGLYSLFFGGKEDDS